MEHYVTLFDSLYLPQGLALHMSMQRCAQDYTLWILCMDDEVHGVLSQFQLPNVCLLQLSKLETDALKRVKPTRTKGEYCWTVTPFAPRFVFEADTNVGRVTYLDADMWFRKNPEPIFREFEASGKQVLITDHAYAPEYDESEASGQYCVQFVTFTREGGEIVRAWWEARCVEWCFARVEDGKFGDQKYLDDWPERFANHVYVLHNKELLLAPWNATRFPYSGAVCWHFHGLRILVKSNNVLGVICGNYPLPLTTRRHVYAKYLEDLRIATKQMLQINVKVLNQGERTLKKAMRAFLVGSWHQLRRINVNIYMRM